MLEIDARTCSSPAARSCDPITSRAVASATFFDRLAVSSNERATERTRASGPLALLVVPFFSLAMGLLLTDQLGHVHQHHDPGSDAGDRAHEATGLRRHDRRRRLELILR